MIREEYNCLNFIAFSEFEQLTQVRVHKVVRELLRCIFHETQM